MAVFAEISHRPESTGPHIVIERLVAHHAYNWNVRLFPLANSHHAHLSRHKSNPSSIKLILHSPYAIALCQGRTVSPYKQEVVFGLRGQRAPGDQNFLGPQVGGLPWLGGQIAPGFGAPQAAVPPLPAGGLPVLGDVPLTTTEIRSIETHDLPEEAILLPHIFGRDL
jgi:hypothetical protein